MQGAATFDVHNPSSQVKMVFSGERRVPVTIAPGCAAIVEMLPETATRFAERTGLVFTMRRVPTPALAESRVAVIVGGADCVLAEYVKAEKLCIEAGINFTTLVINDMIAEFQDRIDHAVTLHPDVRLNVWLEERQKNCLPPPANVWAYREADVGVNMVTRVCPEWGKGSSGLLAVKIALRELSCDRVILCGVPMTMEGGHFKRKQPWKAVTNNFRAEWQARHSELAPYVRSWSGWTAELFGVPTWDFVKFQQEGMVK
jgi:hypothetical protein